MPRRKRQASHAPTPRARKGAQPAETDATVKLVPVVLIGKMGEETGVPTADQLLKISTADGMIGPYFLRDERRAVWYYGADTYLLLVEDIPLFRGDPYAPMIAVPVERVFYA